jgi:hypothetical protein
MLDWQSKQWRYAGGGNDAKWSPDSSEILWTTQQTLELSAGSTSGSFTLSLSTPKVLNKHH